MGKVGGGRIFFLQVGGGLTLDDTMVLKGIIIACHHIPTWMVAWDFSHVYIASEFCGKSCDCYMSHLPLFFIC